MKQFKIYAFMAGFTLLFIWFGKMIAGQNGMIIALLVTVGINFYIYYYIQQLVLEHTYSKHTDAKEESDLYEIVHRLVKRTDLHIGTQYLVQKDKLMKEQNGTI